MNLLAFLARDGGDGSGPMRQLRDGGAEAMAPASETDGAIPAGRRAEPRRRGADGTGPVTGDAVNHLRRPDCVGLPLKLAARDRTTAPDRSTARDPAE